MRYHMKCREKTEINSMELKRRKRAMKRIYSCIERNERSFSLQWFMRGWSIGCSCSGLLDIQLRLRHHAPTAYGAHMHDGCFEWAQKKVVKMSQIAEIYSNDPTLTFTFQWFSLLFFAFDGFHARSISSSFHPLCDMFIQKWLAIHTLYILNASARRWI